MELYPPNRKDWLASIWIGFPSLLLLLFAFNYQELIQKPYLVVMLLQLGLPLWMYFDLSYRIKDGSLYYRFGYNKGRIPIANIREIKPGKFSWSGEKASVASKGIFIAYNKYDDLFISPIDSEKLIQDLRLINPAIKVTGFGQKEGV